MTVTVWLCPAATVNDAGDTVNAASLEEMPLAMRGETPPFVTMKVRCPDCPARTLPKASVAGATLTEDGWVLLPFSVTEDGLLGAL